ncbi:MAG: nicotinate-nucleotide adenylyltransferase [Actinomycetota bacterium]
MSRTPDPRRRIGIMGGTFDPIHNGHLVCAEEARCQLELDEVIFVPAGNPWQKGGGVSSAEDRYLMTVLATASHENFSVSRIEIDRKGPSYTLDTLRVFRSFYDDVELFFITGADAVAEILSWKDPEAVLNEAHFVAATRPGYDIKNMEPVLEKVSVMHIPALAISSSDIRARVASGRPVRYLMPREVAQFIATRGLYSSRGYDLDSGTTPKG